MTSSLMLIFDTERVSLSPRLFIVTYILQSVPPYVKVVLTIKKKKISAIDTMGSCQTCKDSGYLVRLYERWTPMKSLFSTLTLFH